MISLETANYRLTQDKAQVAKTKIEQANAAKDYNRNDNDSDYARRNSPVKRNERTEYGTSRSNSPDLDKYRRQNSDTDHRSLSSKFTGSHDREQVRKSQGAEVNRRKHISVQRPTGHAPRNDQARSASPKPGQQFNSNNNNNTKSIQSPLVNNDRRTNLSRSLIRDNKRLRSPSPGLSKYMPKSKVGFQMPSAQLVEDLQPNSNNDEYEDDGFDPDLRDRCVEVAQDGIEEEDESWQDDEVLGQAHIATHTPVICDSKDFTRTDIADWRSRNAECQQLLTDNNVIFMMKHQEMEAEKVRDTIRKKNECDRLRKSWRQT